MKLFHFYRIEDESGVSGTGPVVEGVEFTNGWCAIRWLSSKSSMCFYKSMEDVKAIHGHGGKTEVVVHDLEPLRRRADQKTNTVFESFLEIVEETSKLMTLTEDPDTSPQDLHYSFRHLRDLLDQIESQVYQKPPKVA